jgi:hypothetical protein
MRCLSNARLWPFLQLGEGPARDATAVPKRCRRQVRTEDFRANYVRDDVGRYHVRAYCHDLLNWVDLVLPRIIAAQHADTPGVSGDGDIDWHQREDLSFFVNPALPESAQAAVRLDYLPQGAELLLVQGVRKASVRR